MRTLATIVITAAVCSGFFLCNDFGRDIQKDVAAAKRFVQIRERARRQGNGISFRTAGLLRRKTYDL